jgi:ferredoxin
MLYPRAMPLLRFLPDGHELRVPAGTLLIDAVRRAGLPIASSCGSELVCARCAVRVVRGSLSPESPLEQRAKQRNRLAEQQRLACAVRVHDDLVLHADYWGPLRSQAEEG